MRKDDSAEPRMSREPPPATISSAARRPLRDSALVTGGSNVLLAVNSLPTDMWIVFAFIVVGMLVGISGVWKGWGI